MNSKFDYIGNKKIKLEDNIDAELIITSYKQILNQVDRYPPKVVFDCLKVMWRLASLDIIDAFEYSSEKENPYFIEICKHYQTYIHLLEKVASIHTGRAEKRTSSNGMIIEEDTEM